MISDDEIVERFKYHKPSSPAVVEAHEAIRGAFLNLALKMADILPEGREKAVLSTKLEEALFWANAAVARTQRIGP